MTHRLGSLSEILRPAQNGLNYDPIRTNDQRSKNTAASHTPVKSLKCWYINADSLLNKIDELKARIYMCVQSRYYNHH